MRIFITLMICMAYVVIGSQLQKFEIITHPAYWALFGAIVGIAISQVWR